jgi:hypothetical protein
MTSALDITRSAGAPRAAFLDYPLGHTTGKAGEPELQRAILADALRAFESTEPGHVRMLPFRWDDAGDWKAAAFAGADERQPRFAEPQWQSDDDRRAAEACGACVRPS